MEQKERASRVAASGLLKLKKPTPAAVNPICSWPKPRTVQPMSVSIVDMHAEHADVEFVRSLKNTGFAVLRNSPLDADRLLRMGEAWKAFFLSPDKWQYKATETPSGNTSGFISTEVSETAVGHDQKDLKEFFHIVPCTNIPEGLRADAQAHLSDAQALGRTLLGWVDKHCAADLAETLRGKLAASLSPDDSLLRILHYPPLSDEVPEGAIRAAAHEDINLLTLLPVSTEPGLQVALRSGEWAEVPGQFGDIIINAGDMLQEASGGVLRSTSHRVVNPIGPSSQQSRISLPYFIAPFLDSVLSDRYTAGSYLHERLAQLAR